jgi:hypothetical protein
MFLFENRLCGLITKLHASCFHPGGQITQNLDKFHTHGFVGNHHSVVVLKMTIALLHVWLLTLLCWTTWWCYSFMNARLSFPSNRCHDLHFIFTAILCHCVSSPHQSFIVIIILYYMFHLHRQSSPALWGKKLWTHVPTCDELLCLGLISNIAGPASFHCILDGALRLSL